MNPSKSIRKYCVWCMGGNAQVVNDCDTELCPIYKLREGKRVKGIKTLKQIRLKCLDCSTFRVSEVRGCRMVDCSLYPYRMGKNPNRKGIGGKGFFQKGISYQKDSTELPY